MVIEVVSVLGGVVFFFVFLSRVGYKGGRCCPPLLFVIFVIYFDAISVVVVVAVVVAAALALGEAAARREAPCGCCGSCLCLRRARMLFGKFF